MSEIHVVLDSTAHVEPELFARYPNLHVVPLKVLLGNQEWPEDALTNDELFKLIEKNGQFPKTSQPSPGQFVEVLTPLYKAGHTVIIIALSGALSGTAQSAQNAINLLGAKDMYVVDSGTTAVGMCMLAEAVFAMAQKGVSVAGIVDRLHDIIKITHTMFVPRSLEHLYKGGRIGGAAALFGSILQIKPVLYLVEGKVTVLDKVRTSAKAVSRMVDELDKYTPLSRIGIVYIGDKAAGEALGDTVRRRYPEVQVTVSTGGSVLGSHLGYGLVGLIFQQSLE